MPKDLSVFSFRVCSFDQLSVRQLYDILQLRSEVFVVEQQCAYTDPDGKDQSSLHLCMYRGETIIAYCRMLPAGVAYASASIGRVLTRVSERRAGFGRKLVEQAIAFIENEWKADSIRIGAQTYLRKFYESLGFEAVSDEYDEDGIPHIEMLRRK